MKADYGRARSNFRRAQNLLRRSAPDEALEEICKGLLVLVDELEMDARDLRGLAETAKRAAKRGA